MKRTYILIISLFLLLITGCSDCDSDYDTVGVRIDDFALRTGIVINTNIPDISVCNSTYVTNTNCNAKLNNQGGKTTGINKGFAIQCANINNNSSSYLFDLEQTIQLYFPMESYKEKDDLIEKCTNYWIYDFFSTVYKSERALSIDNVNVDAENANIWYVSIGGTCYQWDVTNSNYAVVK